MKYPIFSHVFFCFLTHAVFADKLLLDFEKSRDVNLWEVKTGPGISRSSEATLQGASALKVEMDTHITTSLLPRDWSGHKALSFDVFNPLDTPVSIGLVLADLAWLDKKNYWNQHHRFVLVKSGRSAVRIPLNNLYRGRKDQRNVDVVGNLDPSSIVRMELEFKGQKGSIYLDNFQLVSGETPVVTTPETKKNVSSNLEIHILNDVESVREVKTWERREGWFLPMQVAEHATHGAHALKVGGATLLVNNNLPQDWSGYSTFAFDVFNPEEDIIHLELMIGDVAWIQAQHYYNRHNAIHRIVPGANTVNIDLSSLYRGESNRRNTLIPRNVDIDSIAQMNVHVLSKKGFLYFDYFRLQSGVDSMTAPDKEKEYKEAKYGALIERALLTNIWNDFESLKDQAQWEVRKGPKPRLSDLHTTHGENSLNLSPGNLLATYAAPRNWQGYQSFEFDVFNEGDGVVKVEVMIGDNAWTKKQTYWNRFNGIYMLVPGPNTISVPVNGLYRGEASSQNRDINRNIDTDSITQINLWFKEGQGNLYLDKCRLAGEVGNESEVSLSSGKGGKAMEKKLFDFEDLRDVAAWEKRRGEKPQWVEEHATSGKKSLKINSGALIVSHQLPQDWSGYDALEFDVYNAGQEVLRIEIMIGDLAWTQKQTYWNRHNAIYPLVPGENQISIPVKGMYRGEAGSRNRDIARDIDADNIVQMNIGIIRGAGEVYIDNMRLSKAGKTTAQVWGYDFGPENQALWPGFLPVSWNTEYSQERGYGLECKQVKKKYAGDTTFPTRLFQDYVWIEQGDFRVDVPPGTYVTHVFFESAGYWAGEHSKFSVRSITAENREVIREDRRASGIHDEALYTFQDIEPLSGKDVLQTYYKHVCRPRTFVSKVSDGQLNILPWSDARQGTRVSSIVIHRAEDEDAIAWVKQLQKKNLKELKSRSAELPPPPSRKTTQKKHILFVPELEQNVYYNTLPSNDALRRKVENRGVRGETVVLTFAIRPFEKLTNITIEIGDFISDKHFISASNVTLSIVRHQGKRGYGDLSFQVKPWYLAPLKPMDMPAKTTRQFWLAILIPKKATPGEYQGTIRIKKDGKSLWELPCALKVYPFTLDEPGIPISFFGIRQEMLKIFRNYGATAVCGGPQIHLIGFNQKKMPEIDFTSVDAYMRTARKLGYSEPIMDYGGPISIAGMQSQRVRAFFERWGQKAGLTAKMAGQRVFDAIQQHAKKEEWPALSINLVDEPRTKADSLAYLDSIRFVNEVAPWIKTIGYFNFVLKHDPADREILFHEIDGVALKNYSGGILKAAEQSKKELYLYSLGRNRYTLGALLWAHHLNGIKGYVQWHAFIVHGYQFFDLDGREPDMGLVVKRRDGIYPTLDLERIRLGINDFRYLTTLSRIAKQKKDQKAQNYLKQLVERINIHSRAKPENLKLSEMRNQLSDLLSEMHIE